MAMEDEGRSNGVLDSPSAPSFEDEIWSALIVERAVQRVLAAYGRAVDERDFERIRGCFHPDAEITYGDEPTRLRDEAIAWLQEVTPPLFALSHYFGPAVVDVSADGRSATCQCWCLNVIQYPRDEAGAERQTAAGLLYDDVFELREGRWLISRRRNRTEWSLEIEGNARLPVPESSA
jgi:hypothetical protein